jgi:hypothetical protein
MYIRCTLKVEGLQNSLGQRPTSIFHRVKKSTFGPNTLVPKPRTLWATSTQPVRLAGG